MVQKTNPTQRPCGRFIKTNLRGLSTRPPLVVEVSDNFRGYRVRRGQRDGSLRPYSRLSRPEPLHFLPSSSSIVLRRLGGPRSSPTTSQKIWWRRESNPDLWICSQEFSSLDHRGGHARFIHFVLLTHVTRFASCRSVAIFLTAMPLSVLKPNVFHGPKLCCKLTSERSAVLFSIFHNTFPEL
jgi:hypothetical protein